ncbi:MAG: MmcQ/YjbR family DNA-binding protein, partial [Lachnospiraceae bacterium]|nr:MmcQ/YjbR family DNA-binding protein [Lachnospiraceae bacterium]
MEKKTLREEIITYGKKKYHSDAEYLWADTPDAAVLRHSDNRKWYALIMEVSRARLGLCGEGAVDVLNVKCDPDMVVMLQSTQGFLPAYHMSKTKWISVLLDGTVEKDMVLDMVDKSFGLTAPKKPVKK